MAKWDFHKVPSGNTFQIDLLRNGQSVGYVVYSTEHPELGICYVRNIMITPGFQREYMEYSKGLKMGEALALQMVESLKKAGIKAIFTFSSLSGRRFLAPI